MFLGFASEGFKQEKQTTVKVGEEITVGAFTVRHDALRVTADAQKQMVTGHVTVFEDGKEIGQMHPARWFYSKREEEPTTEVAIRRSAGEDLYIVLTPDFDAATQRVTYAVTVNPLVNWIWIGFGIMAIGSIIALLPEASFATAMARVPANAATTTLLLLLLLPSALHAQHVEAPQFKPTAPQTELERELGYEIICMCGTCGRKRIGECTCGLAAQMRAEVAQMVAQGRSREQIYEYYMAKYGSQEPLAMPIDRGFNRLAWLFPYVMGASGAFMVGLVALRWSRRTAHDEPAAAGGAPIDDPALQQRLDDELRDLD
jgi:cytochrome c-type biogenesis protein CcmH/NrfF